MESNHRLSNVNLFTEPQFLQSMLARRRPRLRWTPYDLPDLMPMLFRFAARWRSCRLVLKSRCEALDTSASRSAACACVQGNQDIRDCSDRQNSVVVAGSIQKPEMISQTR